MTLREQYFQQMLHRLDAKWERPGGARVSLSALRSTEMDDPTVALFYAWAAAADILSFYTDRVGAESYLDSARSPRSLAFLANGVDYRPDQFLAASTVLALTVDRRVTAPLRLPPRTRFKSNSPAGGASVAFETRQPAEVSAQLNRFDPTFSVEQAIGMNSVCAIVAGIRLGLAPGEPLLLVQPDPYGAAKSAAWQIAWLTNVEERAAEGVTHLVWTKPLWNDDGTLWPLAGAEPVQVHAFSTQAGLFGNSAREWAAAPYGLRSAATPFGLTPADYASWPGFEVDWRHLDLDRTIAPPAPESYVLAVTPARNLEGAAATQRLGRILSSDTEILKRWTVTGHVTRLETDLAEPREARLDYQFVAAGTIPGGPEQGSGTIVADGTVFLAFAAPPACYIWGPQEPFVEPIVDLAPASTGFACAPLSRGRVLIAGGFAFPGLEKSNACQIYPPPPPPPPSSPPSTPSLIVPRALAQATRLATGDILVTGGADAGASCGSEIFDCRTGAFIALEGGPSGQLYGHVPVLLPDGCVLIMGGNDENGVNGDLWLFDPEAGWRLQLGCLLHPAAWASATLLLDGTILFAGGRDINYNGAFPFAEIFDPAGKASEPVPPLNDARFMHSAALMPDGRVIIADGMTQVPGDPSTAEPVATAEIFDPRSSTFTRIGGPRFNHVGGANVRVPGRGLLLAGGYHAHSASENIELFHIPPFPIDEAPRRTSRIYLGSRQLTLVGLPDARPFPDPRPSPDMRAIVPLDGLVTVKAGDALLLSGVPPFARLAKRIQGENEFGFCLSAEEGSYAAVLGFTADIDTGSYDARLALRGGTTLYARCPAEALVFLADPQGGKPPPPACQPFPEAPADLPSLLPRATIAEVVEVIATEATETGTAIMLGPTHHLYSRTAVSLFGNLVEVHEGRSIVGEVLGSGTGAGPGAAFLLRQFPVMSALVDDEAVADVEIRVSDILWRRQDRLDRAGPLDEVYRLDADNLGRVRISFGDGVNGALPSAGNDNIMAGYRVGGGQGDLPAGSITRAPAAPPGIHSALQPLPARGSLGAAPADDLRGRIAASTISLGRVVAIEDITAFALNSPGVADAIAERSSLLDLVLDCLSAWRAALQAIEAEVAARFDPVTAQSPPPAELSDPLAEMQRLLAPATDDLPAVLVEKLLLLLEPLAAGLAAHLPPAAVKVPLATLGLAAEAVRFLLSCDPVAEVWFVTVAGPDGALLDPALLNRLNAQLIRCGAASGALVRARNYARAYFDVGVAIRPRPGADAATLERAVRASLLARWGFSLGRLGRPIAASDILAAILAVQGVDGGKVIQLNLHGQPSDLGNLLEARSSGSGPAKLLIPRNVDVALVVES